MTQKKRREGPAAPSPASASPQQGHQKSGHSNVSHAHRPRSRGNRTAPRRHSVQPVEQAITPYGELLQDVQDETSFFLPVEALLAGTHRYLYHLGDFSEENCVRLLHFLQEKKTQLEALQQGKLSAGERRSSALLRSYMSDLEQLLEGRCFQDTLWQLHNARVALYQPLYITEIPTYARGKALLHRLEEFSTPPTAPAGGHVSFPSSRHVQLAAQELRLIDEYLAYAEANAGKFDDKQAIAERIVHARQYTTMLHSRIARGTVDAAGSSAATCTMSLMSFLNEQEMSQTAERLAQELQELNERLAVFSAHLDPVHDTVETAAALLRDACATPCDQAFIDKWMATSYQQLRPLFPGYKLRMVPVQSQTPGNVAPYDRPQVLFLLGVSLMHHEPLCLLLPSHRWLSPEITLMAEYFPGRAYLQAATASWNPSLAFDRQHDLYVSALTLFELQNMTVTEGILTPGSTALITMQLLLEDATARLDIALLQKQTLPGDGGTYLQQQLPWLPRDLAEAYSDNVLLEPGAAAARAALRFKLDEMRISSRANNRKTSWSSFYQSIFEQGTFDPFQMRTP